MPVGIASSARLLGSNPSYTQALEAAGVLRGGAELAPVGSATCVRVQNGKPVITDGPFAETKEQLGGYYLLDCANLDEALATAFRKLRGRQCSRAPSIRNRKL